MTLRYIANIRLPTEKAHGLQIMKTCEALARAGASIELVIPIRRNPLCDEPFAYYGMQPSFSIVRLPVPDTVGLGMIGFLFQTYAFARAAARYCTGHPADLAYGRDERVLAYLASRGIPVVWETHTGAWNRPARQLTRQARSIIAISNGLRAYYIEHGVPERLIAVAPDAIDIAAFEVKETREAARQRLGLPLDVKIIAYIGRLDEGKGAFTFLAAAQFFPKNSLAVVIGGEPEQVRALSAQYPAVRFLGPRPYRELPSNQAAADVLVIPNSAHDAVSAKFTSPLKLFAALASLVPIVASDVPSIREALDPSMAYLFAPDDPAALADAVREALENPQESRRRAEAAIAAARMHTWNMRAQRILEALATT